MACEFSYDVVKDPDGVMRCHCRLDREHIAKYNAEVELHCTVMHGGPWVVDETDPRYEVRESSPPRSPMANKLRMLGLIDKKERRLRES
jgi:hypothetical protein